MYYLKNVATLKYNSEKCIGCGQCISVCPHAVFAGNGRKVLLRDFNACMECGACMRNCPTGAINVRPGVGCAYAIALGKIKNTEPTCGCSDDGAVSCCS